MLAGRRPTLPSLSSALVVAVMLLTVGVSARQAWEGAQARIDDATSRLARTLSYATELPDMSGIEVAERLTSPPDPPVTSTTRLPMRAA